MVDSFAVRVREAAREAVRRPASLTALLAAVNAVLLPYAGLKHDAVLYGLQALNNTLGGHFDRDLYFAHGSQDRFSAFSLAAGPLVRAAGLPAGFLLGYLAANGLYLVAVARLCRRLVPDPVAAVAAAVLLATTQTAFGGLDVFRVPENFLTPRLPAVALVLVGLERMLAGRPGQAAGAVALAFPLHPLMAVGGALVVGGWLVATRVPRPVAVGLVAAGAAGGAAVLAVDPVGVAVFGRMDDAWRADVRAANPYHFPGEWQAVDWWWLAARAAAVGLAAGTLPGPRRRLLLWLALGAAGVGLAAAAVAPHRPYALLLMGQPYRAVWVVEYLAAPCGLAVAARWWAGGRPAARAAAAGLAAGVTVPALADGALPLAVLAFPVAAVACRGLGPTPKAPDWAARSLAAAAAAAAVGWGGLQARAVAELWPALREDVDPVTLARLVPSLAEPAVKVAAGLAVLGWVWGRVGPRARAGAAAAAVLLQAAGYGVTLAPGYAARYQPGRADVEFVAGAVAAGPAAPPTVYWPNDRVADVWFGLRALSYYEWPHQVAGNLFSRAQAREGGRRMALVRVFEHERWARWPVLQSRYSRLVTERNYGPADRPPTPTADDLARVCRDPAVDFVVVRLGVPGWYQATNGTWYVYDCRHLRAHALAGRPEETP